MAFAVTITGRTRCRARPVEYGQRAAGYLYAEVVQLVDDQASALTPGTVHEVLHSACSR